MEDSEMRDRAERFLKRLDALGDVTDGFEYEIEQGLKMLGASIVSDFVRDAACAHYALGQIAGNVMDGARVRLPKPPKKELPTEAGPDPNVIRFPGDAAEKRAGA